DGFLEHIVYCAGLLWSSTFDCHPVETGLPASNPVKAGLAGMPEEFAWSSATPSKRAAGRGRDSGYPLPPARSRGATNAHGSYLGLGHIWRRNARLDTVAA